MSQPLVSVIIPTYNAEKFIIESIESVLQQNYKNIEIIIADDCSSDNTKKIIKNYFKDNNIPNIKFFFNESNLGITKNCNLCLSACIGEYVAFHAGDDVMLPGKITAQVDYMEKNEKCIITCHNIDVFESESNKTLYYYNGIMRHKGRSGDVRTLIKHGMFCGGCSFMIKKDRLPIGGYDERFSVASDWWFFVNVLMSGGEIHYIQKVLSRYRRHSNNVTLLNTEFRMQGYIDTLNICNDIIINKPEFAKEALCAYGLYLRGLRHDHNGENYKVFVVESLKLYFDIRILGILVLNIISFGKIRL